jgi:hypothetical protein
VRQNYRGVMGDCPTKDTRKIPLRFFNNRDIEKIIKEYNDGELLKITWETIYD